ncbi:MAG: methylenetetrahydrofolate reductase [Proteobacteria bacterium]|nr:methylenetetrahydrofolate reductase [Pseudomonadota bacterium]
MRVTHLYDQKKPVISMEFFPPRNEKAKQSFGKIIDELAELKPDYMSVYTVKMVTMLSRICGTSISKNLQLRLDSVNADDKEAVLKLGIDFATDQCRDLLAGLHFYTMDRSYSTKQIMSNLHLY